MKISKKLLSLLAIFCLVASAGAVFAADYNGNLYGLEPGAGLPLENQTGPSHANSTNTTGNATGNTTANATGNATHATPHTLLATGNPVFILLAVCGLIGCYGILRRKQ